MARAPRRAHDGCAHFFFLPPPASNLKTVASVTGEKICPSTVSCTLVSNGESAPSKTGVSHATEPSSANVPSTVRLSGHA
eukprot:35172-Prymnesium_polylepis.1